MQGGQRRRHAAERGQSQVELALVLVLVAVGVTVGARAVGIGTSSSMNQVSTGLAGAAQAPSGVAVTAETFVDDTTATDPMSAMDVTAPAGSVLLAWVASDGPSSPQTATVSGGGLVWHLAVRNNSNPGDTELWWASPATQVTAVTITATRSLSGCNTGVCDGMLAVEVVTGANTTAPVAAHTSTSSSTTTSAGTVVTTQANSLVLAAGNDYTSATARTAGSGSAFHHQDVSTPNGDDYWLEGAVAGAPSGTSVTLSSTGPTGDQTNLVVAEIVH